MRIGKVEDSTNVSSDKPPVSLDHDGSHLPSLEIKPEAGSKLHALQDIFAGSRIYLIRPADRRNIIKLTMAAIRDLRLKINRVNRSKGLIRRLDLSIPVRRFGTTEQPLAHRPGLLASIQRNDTPRSMLRQKALPRSARHPFAQKTIFDVIDTALQPQLSLLTIEPGREMVPHPQARVELPGIDGRNHPPADQPVFDDEDTIEPNRGGSRVSAPAVENTLSNHFLIGHPTNPYPVYTVIPVLNLTIRETRQHHEKRERMLAATVEAAFSHHSNKMGR
jgi:hypothetical protein